MRMTGMSQVTLEQLRDVKHIDAIIAASGYETRCTFLPNLLSDCEIQKRYVLGFKDRITVSRIENDKEFMRLGYKSHEADGDSDDVIQLILQEILSIEQDNISIIVDYSSMTRVWYAAIISIMPAIESGPKEVNIFFSYTPAEFAEPETPTPNKVMGPIPGFCRPQLPSKSTALIIGLGYVRERALGLYEYVEAAETYAFYTNPALYQEFTDRVIQNNSELLDLLSEDRVFQYPMDDLMAVNNMLSYLCIELSDNHRIILAPLGPKPFILISLLLYLQFPELAVDIWRVSAGSGGKFSDRKPHGTVFVCGVSFSRIDDIQSIDHTIAESDQQNIQCELSPVQERLAEAIKEQFYLFACDWCDRIDILAKNGVEEASLFSKLSRKGIKILISSREDDYCFWLAQQNPIPGQLILSALDIEEQRLYRELAKTINSKTSFRLLPSNGD